MTGYEQCSAANGRWHVETVLRQNSENTRKENVEFSLYFDACGRPRIDVKNFAVFTRSTPRGTWKLEKIRRRRVTKAEKLKLLGYAKRLVGQFAAVELVPVAPKEPLPVTLLNSVCESRLAMPEAR